MRFLSIIMHQQIENCINNIIRHSFKHSEKIVDSPGYIFGFEQKYIIAQALGIFDSDRGKKLKTNINEIQRLRNYYAHEIDSASGKKIQEPQEHQINAMYNFFEPPSKIDKSDLVLMFKMNCLSTIAELNKV
ncbi:MAG: hypothetical protein WAW52_10750 [Methanothrix sp.]